MIVVFGSINLDVVARVARLPRPGETIGGDSVALLPGGKGANQALAARRAGATVAMAGAVGSDAFAPVALAGLEAAGVDVAAVARVDAPTGIALIHVDAQGENAITVIRGANAKARPRGVQEAALGPGSTLLLQLEVPLAAVAAAASRARRLGARVMLNAAPAHPLPAALLDALDVLIVNAVEAAAIGRTLGLATAPEAFATALARRHRCVVVVTLGAAGAIAVVDRTRLAIAAPAVGVVDTTGAGDAFTGALAAALDRGAAWPRALAEGVAAGSLACIAAGAQPALPAAPDIARLAGTLEPGIDARPLD